MSYRNVYLLSIEELSGILSGLFKKINMRIFKLNVYAFFEQLTVRVISVPK